MFTNNMIIFTIMLTVTAVFTFMIMKRNDIYFN